jgi:hypothetical protein
LKCIRRLHLFLSIVLMVCTAAGCQDSYAKDLEYCRGVATAARRGLGETDLSIAHSRILRMVATVSAQDAADFTPQQCLDVLGCAALSANHRVLIDPLCLVRMALRGAEANFIESARFTAYLSDAFAASTAPSGLATSYYEWLFAQGCRVPSAEDCVIARWSRSRVPSASVESRAWSSADLWARFVSAPKDRPAVRARCLKLARLQGVQWTDMERMALLDVYRGGLLSRQLSKALHKPDDIERFPHDLQFELARVLAPIESLKLEGDVASALRFDAQVAHAVGPFASLNSPALAALLSPASPIDYERLVHLYWRTDSVAVFRIVEALAVSGDVACLRALEPGIAQWRAVK